MAMAVPQLCGFLWRRVIPSKLDDHRNCCHALATSAGNSYPRYFLFFFPWSSLGWVMGIRSVFGRTSGQASFLFQLPSLGFIIFPPYIMLLFLSSWC